jgi:hypothetical protein
MISGKMRGEGKRHAEIQHDAVMVRNLRRQRVKAMLRMQQAHVLPG